MDLSSGLSSRFFSFASANSHLFSGRYVVSFHPFSSEPQINIEREARDEPYRVAYVRIENWDQREMTARAARRDTPDLWEEFHAAKNVHIHQPRALQPVCEREEVAAVLVPGAAFTPSGVRLGRGAGFYDRFLRLHPAALRIGIAFEVQMAGTLPFDEWDERVDIVLTDRAEYSSKTYEEWRIHGKILNRTSS
jgi:5,10-methenyltetrahydrofolate synthetase